MSTNTYIHDKNTRRGRKLLTEDNFQVLNVYEAKDPSGITNTAVEIKLSTDGEYRKLINIYRPTIKEAVNIRGLNLPVTDNTLVDKQNVLLFFASHGIHFESAEFRLFISPSAVTIEFLKNALSFIGKIQIASLDGGQIDDNILMTNTGQNLQYQNGLPVLLNQPL